MKSPEYHSAILSALIIFALGFAEAASAACDQLSDSPGLSLEIRTPPPGIDRYYRKYFDARGIPIVGSDRVLDQSFSLAAQVVNHMLSKRPDIRRALIVQHTRVAILAKDEVFTDLPEMREVMRDILDGARFGNRDA